MKQNKQYSIAIIYLAIGKYDVFWNEFYASCEQFLFCEANKEYFVFTDSKELLSLYFPNVSMIYYEDRGWAVNVSSKSDCILQIYSVLESFDYIFYINANYKILDYISCQEILPGESNDYLVALSFDHFVSCDKDSYPYDRNSKSLAYIPYGQGIHYYQASFYGGRSRELLLLAQTCSYNTQIDFSKGIIASWQDESYLNKYLLDYNPRIIGTYYGKPEHFTCDCKAIFRDKIKIIGRETLDQMKIVFVNPVLSYLRDKELGFTPLHLVKIDECLTTQMFQYAFLLSLRNKCEKCKCLLYMQDFSITKNVYISDLEKIFSISIDNFMSDELKIQVGKTPSLYIRHVQEQYIATYQHIRMDWDLVTVYSGAWETERYFEDISSKIRNVFHFDTNKLNKKSKCIEKIIRSCIAVGVHVESEDGNRSVFNKICTQEYYKKSIALVKKYSPDRNLQFFLFCKDKEWINRNIFDNDFILVDWNFDSENWQDMYLMSICRHNILSISNLSWWGGWLNDCEDKVIVAPYRWSYSHLAPDIVPKNWLTVYPDLFLENDLIETLKIQSDLLIDDSLFYGKMGLIIFLFHYSNISGDKFYENYAETMIDLVFERLNTSTPLRYADGLIGIGTGIEYLFQNGFIQGNIDEVLSDIDLLFENVVFSNVTDYSLETGVSGWLRYFRFRLMGAILNENVESIEKNRKYLNNLLKYLKGQLDLANSDLGDIVDELYMLKSVWDAEIDILDLTSNIKNVSYTSMCFDSFSVGLKGMSGRELSKFSPESKINWTDLL